MSTMSFCRLRAQFLLLCEHLRHDISKQHCKTFSKALFIQKTNFRTLYQRSFTHIPELNSGLSSVQLLLGRQTYSNRSKRQTSDTLDEEDSDTDTDDALETDSDVEDLDDGPTEGGVNTPKGYTEKVVTSGRIDGIIGKTLTTSTSLAQTLFYSRQIHLNGQVARKKSLKVKEGDYLSVDRDEKQYQVMVKIVKVHEEKTRRGKQKVTVHIVPKNSTLDNKQR